ncbi:MAG: monothiol bacilliredoxin BrxC family protein [Dehalococcoidia bacterium]
MDSQFDEVATEGELEQAFARSERAPVLLYLHDPYCGRSAVAHSEVSKLGMRIAWINVHARHDLGMEVERLTGVRHESPQALILRHRQARWSASHRNVTASAILAALDAAEEPVATSSAGPRRRWSALRDAFAGLGRSSES